MDVQEKLDILARDAQYDLSCACGTKKPEEHRKKNALGDRWLYPVTVAGGGSGIMLKTLMTNGCGNDCKYCPLRSQKDFRRVSLEPSELASFFMEFQRKRHMIGLFLSSGVIGNPDRTMERLVGTAEILRKKYRYRGYVHLKIIPGASQAAIDKAMSYASAVSLNIETPGEKHFHKLTDRKRYETDIVSPLRYISEQTRRGGPFPRVHTSSQFIVGASDETDQEILQYGWAMYRNLEFERLYYSAYQNGLGDPSIPGERQLEKELIVEEQPTLFELPPVYRPVGAQKLLVREHRLYQADWLFRKYRFDYDDLLFDTSGNLDLTKDPKQRWADAHPEYYPVSVRKASLNQLLRVPGIGPTFARRIVDQRKDAVLCTLDDLRLPNAYLKKASPYLEL